MPTPMPSTVFDPWSVVLVPFPLSAGPAGEEGAEQNRPAVVISSPRLGEEQGLYWIAMITSPPLPAKSGQIPITDLHQAGLPRPAVVVPSKIMTVSRTMVTRRTGMLSQRDAAVVERIVRGYLAISVESEPPPAAVEPEPVPPGADLKDFAPE